MPPLEKSSLDSRPFDLALKELRKHRAACVDDDGKVTCVCGLSESFGEYDVTEVPW